MEITSIYQRLQIVQDLLLQKPLLIQILHYQNFSLSKACKPDNFESHNSLNLSFMNI